MRLQYSISCFLIAILISCSILVSAQSELSRLINSPYKPTVVIADFSQIYFKWPEGKAQAYMNDGLNDLREGKLNTASGNFSKVIELSPRFYAGYYYRGICSKLLLDLDNAEKDFNKSLEYNDTLASAQIEIGEIYEIKENFLKAEECYDFSIKMQSGYYDGYLHLGNLFYFQRDTSRAIALYKTCIKINPELSQAYTKLGILKLKEAKNNAEAMKLLSLAIQKDANAREALFWRGMIWINMREEEKGLKDLTDLIRITPGNPLFLFVRGYLYTDLGQFDEAYRDLKEAVLANRENEDKFAGDQTSRDKRIDLQSAMRYFIRKIYGFNEPDLSYLKNGFCFMLAGRPKPAMALLSKVEHPSGISNYLEGMIYENNGYHKSALIKYDNAVTLDPEFTEAYKKRGIYMMELKEFKKAFSDFDQMTKLEPGLLVGYRMRGITSALMDDCTAAIDDMTFIIKTDSTDQEIFKTRAFCFEKKMEWLKSGKDFERAFFLGKADLALYSHAILGYQNAVKENPKDPESRYLLGHLLYRAGRKEEGMGYIRKASKEGYAPAIAFLKTLR